MPFNPGNKRAQRARNAPTVGGPMKFGLYPTVGVSLPFLRKLEKCCSRCGAGVTAPCGVTVNVCAACNVDAETRAEIREILRPLATGDAGFPERYCRDCCGPDSSLASLNARLAFLTAKISASGRAVSAAELAVDVAEKTAAQKAAEAAVANNAVANALESKYVQGVVLAKPTGDALAAAQAATADDIRKAIKLVLDQVTATRNTAYATAIKALSEDGNAQDLVYHAEQAYVEARITNIKTPSNANATAEDTANTALKAAQKTLNDAVKALEDTRNAPFAGDNATLAALASLSDAALVLKHQQSTYDASIEK